MDSYLDITLHAPTRVDLRQAAGRVLHILHSLLTNSATAGKVGVAFPEWQPNVLEGGHIVQGGSVGHVIRMAGPGSGLEYIAEDAVLIGYLGDGWNGRMGGIKPLPNTDTHVRFARDRRMERTSKRYRQREAKRRTEQFSGVSVRDRSISGADLAETLHILLPSLSTGQYFPLNIRREEMNAPVSGSFNSYGLSSTATVPLF